MIPATSRSLFFILSGFRSPLSAIIPHLSLVTGHSSLSFIDSFYDQTALEANSVEASSLQRWIERSAARCWKRMTQSCCSYGAQSPSLGKADYKEKTVSFR